MRLLFAIKSLNVVGGGAERVLVDVANGMVARGHDVSVLVFDSPGDSFYALDRKVSRINTGIGQPGEPTPRMGFLRAIPKIRRAVLDKKPELVVAFMHSTYVPLSAALMGSGVRLIASEHSPSTHYRSRHVQRALARIADHFALAKTVPTLSMIDSFKSGKIHVLPNTVNLAMFDGVAEKTPKEPPVLLSVGRLMAEKNHLDLVHAFARLAPIFPEWTLRLVGEGELRPMLEAEVAKLGLVPRIALPGVSRDVASEYANASIVVLPSIYESFGLVAAEALASGRPVVAFECCTGVAEMVVNNVNGQLVSVQGDRVSNLCSSLEELMGNADQRRRLGAAGPGSVRRFAINSALDAWESFLLSFQIQ